MATCSPAASFGAIPRRDADPLSAGVYQALSGVPFLQHLPQHRCIGVFAILRGIE